jgi:hypothetical protein
VNLATQWKVVLYFQSEKEFDMIPFLPILLLGFAQIAEQSVLAQHSTQTTPSAVLNSPSFTLPAPPRQFTLGGTHRILVDPENRPEDQNLCFTMRTYLFERRDSFAPEPVGMTTCQPASARRQKQVMSKPRLVPAN